MTPEASFPPPTYASQDVGSGSADDSAWLSEEPQIIITSTTDSLRFQQGYLGADGERAAIEGELQIKGINSSRWRRVFVHPTLLLSPRTRR